MDEEKNEEIQQEVTGKKKSSKGLIIAIVAILLVAIIAGAVWFAVTQIDSKDGDGKEKDDGKTMTDKNNKNESDDSKKTSNNEGLFDFINNIQIANSAKIELEITGEMTSSDNSEEMKAVKELLKALKIKATIEEDNKNEVLIGKVAADYNGKNAITAEGIIQDGKVYAYLDGLFSKYIEIPESSLGGLDLSSMFKAPIDKNVLMDVAEVLNKKIGEAKFDVSDDEVEALGKKLDVEKSTLKMTSSEVADILGEIIDIIAEKADSKTKEALDDLSYELIYMDDSIEFTLDIYKNGSEIVKTDITAVNTDLDELIIISAVKVDSRTWEYTLGYNENGSKVSGAKEILVVTVDGDMKSGTITLKVNSDDVVAKLNIEYKYEANANVSKKSISNSVKADDLSNEDTQEILENIQKNELLYSLIQMAM